MTSKGQMFQVISKSGVTMKTLASEVEARAYVAHLVAAHRRHCCGAPRYLVVKVA